jgi:hypothetical protein
MFVKPKFYVKVYSKKYNIHVLVAYLAWGYEIELWAATGVAARELEAFVGIEPIVYQSIWDVCNLRSEYKKKNLLKAAELLTSAAIMSKLMGEQNG